MTLLQEFADLFLNGNIKPNINDFTGRILVTDVSSSTIIFAEQYFMVEQYHLFPNTTTPSHSHPFSSLTVFLGGDLEGNRNNGLNYVYTDKDINYVGLELPAEQQHGFTVGQRGAQVLVFSHWQDLTQRDSAVLKYTGEHMGPKHQRLKQVYGIE